MLRGDEVKNGDTNNVDLLDVVEALVSHSDEPIDLLGISDSVKMSVVCGELGLRFLRGCVFVESHPRHDHGHVATPLAEQSQ